MITPQVSAKTAQVEMVKRLLKPGRQILDTMTATNMDLLHCAVGVVGELLELSRAVEAKEYQNVVEECGDVYFYGAGLELALGKFLPDNSTRRTQWKPLHPVTMVKAMLHNAGELLDLVKKATIFNKAVKADDILAQLKLIYQGMAEMLREMGYNESFVRDMNIQKLGIRHSSGAYSDNAQNSRADKTQDEDDRDAQNLREFGLSESDLP